MKTMTEINSISPKSEELTAFCKSFIADVGGRYVFGTNSWARSIAKHVKIDAFVDDFTPLESLCGLPVVRSESLSRNARVVSAVVLGRPLTARTRLNSLGVKSIDYFSFKKFSELPLEDVMFMGEFEGEYRSNQVCYENLYGRLKDFESKSILRRLLNFRLTSDLAFMEGFVDAQYRQYFEPFLNLNVSGETFVDIGCYDGYTTEEFIKRCPNYSGVEIFEPEPNNMKRVKSRLAVRERLNYHGCGAASESALLRFSVDGSASRVSTDGELEVRVAPIDSVLTMSPTFIKMDIEGAEYDAIIGAEKTIREYHPRLAISVYHKVDDLRRIPELVLSYRSDYDLYLRHYTEGMTETVMFFIPRKS
jgi:FkbM family methyltransferase